MTALHLLAAVGPGEREEADDGCLEDLPVPGGDEPGVLDRPLQDVVGASPGVVADLVALLAVSEEGLV